MGSKNERDKPSCPPESIRLSSALTGWTGFLLIKAGQIARDILDEELAKLGVTGLRSRHCGILVLLAQGPSTQADLGERLRIDRNSMVALVSDLEKQALLERRRAPNNRSAYAVTLTECGQEIVRHAKAAGRIAEERSLASLSDEEQIELRRLLVLLLANQE